MLWHPKGARVRRLIEDFSRAEHDAAGYELAFTPHLAKSVLWEISGHLDWYADGMYPPMEIEGVDVLPQADELPVPHHDLQGPRSAATASFRCASSSSERSTATSDPA